MGVETFSVIEEPICTTFDAVGARVVVESHEPPHRQIVRATDPSRCTLALHLGAGPHDEFSEVSGVGICTGVAPGAIPAAIVPSSRYCKFMDSSTGQSII